MTRTASSASGPAASVPLRFGKRRDEIQRLTRSRSLSRPRQSIRLMCVAPKDTGCGSCRCLAQASFQWYSAMILQDGGECGSAGVYVQAR